MKAYRSPVYRMVRTLEAHERWMDIQWSISQAPKWKANRNRWKEGEIEEKPGGGGEEGDGRRGDRGGEKAFKADAARTAGPLRFRVCVAGSSAGKVGGDEEDAGARRGCDGLATKSLGIAQPALKLIWSVRYAQTAVRASAAANRQI
ncbi:hypothetical protein ACHAPX_002022 [Trichoderma viride]